MITFPRLLFIASQWIQLGNGSRDPPARIRRNGPTADEPQYYDPCDYPRPMDGAEYAQSCGSAYLGSNIFCDPGNQFSRTEADALAADLKKLNVSSCLCGYPTTMLTGTFERCSEFRAAILFAKVASVHYKRARNSGQGRPRNDVCQRFTAAATPHNGLHTDNMKKFGDDMVQIWREDAKCELDLLFVIFRQWYPSAVPNVDDPQMVVYVSPKLQRRLRKINQGAGTDREVPSWLSTDVRKLGIGRSDVLRGLKAEISNLTKRSQPVVTNDRDQKRSDIGYTTGPTTSFSHFPLGPKAEYQPEGTAISMPDWAIILFIVCILMLPFCVLIGNLVSVVPSRRMSQATPDQMSMRWANKRWRAGFGGGFFGIRWKGQMTTAGDPSAVALQTRAKPQSNNMMFRQFSKFKKPLKPISSAPSEPRTASWTYV